MKKLLLTLLIILFNINNLFANFSNSFSGNIENSYYKENKMLREQIKTRDERLHKMLEDKKNYYSKLNTIKSKNYELKQKLEKINIEINSRDFKKDIFQEIIKNKVNDYTELSNTDIWKFFLILIYLLTSLFLFIFFFIYTLPLRLVRAIWRKITWYEENNCDSSIKNKFNSLFKKYKSLKEEKAELAHHISELEKINIRIKMQNSNYKKDLQKLENYKVREKIKENKRKQKNDFSKLNKPKKETINTEDLFIFEDIKEENIDKKEKESQTESLIKDLSKKFDSKKIYTPKIQYIEENNIETFLYNNTKKWSADMINFDNIWWWFQDPSFVENYLQWMDWQWETADKNLELRLFTNSCEIEKKVDWRYQKRNVKFSPYFWELNSSMWVLWDYIITLSTKEHPFYLIETYNPLLSRNLRNMFRWIWGEKK